MQVVTQVIEPSVLQNIVSYKTLITSSDLTVDTKYVFEQTMSATLLSRRSNDRAPVRFIYRNTKTNALVQISSFDVNSFLCNGKSLEEYFTMYPEAVRTIIAPEFTILSIRHQLADGTRSFVDDKDFTDDNAASPKYRYPLFCFTGYENYKNRKQALTAALTDTALANFRMPADDVKTCRQSPVMEQFLGRHQRQINIDVNLIQVMAEDVEKYEASNK